MIFSLPDQGSAICLLLAVMANSKGSTNMYNWVTRPQDDIALFGHIR